MRRYDEVYGRSLEQPEEFWREAAEAIDWDEPPTRILDDSRAPFYRWFTGGRLNTAYNALDRHVERGRADQPALIYDSPVTGTKRTYTYSELRDEVALFAGALRTNGVERGDRVILYMPMVPEALISMLACARLGAVHSVVFGGFASGELATRIDDAAPKVIVTASCGIEPDRVVAYKPLLDAAIDLAATSRSAASSSSGRRSRRTSSPGGISRGRRRSPARSRLSASRSRRPTRSTSSTPPARPGSRRGSSATPAATRSRSRGRCRTSMTSSRARSTGPPPTSAGSSGTRTSSTRRSSTAARRCSTRGSRSGRRTPARSGG